MKILVGCEESQIVTSAFRAKGHEAYSCDIMPTRGEHPEWHIKKDLMEVMGHPHRYGNQPYYSLNGATWKWDLGIFFVPCDHLAVSGARWFEEKRNDGRQRAAIEFFLKCFNADIPKIAIENPINIMSGKKDYLKKWYPDLYEKAKSLPKPQIIQPWMFGHMEQKATCLWLKGLLPLKETNNVYDEMMKLPRKERERVWHMAPGPDRARDRAVTYAGIGKAMSEQWS
jgi:hypothetical protein